MIHNEEATYASHIITAMKSRQMKLKEHVSRVWHVKKPYMIQVRKPEGGSPLGTLRHGWESNINSSKQVQSLLSVRP
jgi:hypothetical protein